MAAQFVFPGRVDEAGRPQIDPDQREQYRGVLRKLAGLRIEFVIRKPKSKRSLDQNAWWWAVPVRLLAEHCGYTENQMHYALLGECFGYTPGPAGAAVPVKSSSSELSVEEFNKLIDWVLTWAPSELGVPIPAPDDARAAELV